MSIKIIENNKKTIKLEIVIDLESENFLETEDRIMNKVNEVGQTLTKEALKKLDIKETVLSINEQSHYAKEVKKNIRPLMER
ncbi:MAG: hypothetical protein KAU90_09930 [Sulfurovaceae bacterium]|nr:hypothetical protein [Sulfurovaceae bacterium]